MKYKNEKTKAILESTTHISGGFWKAIETPKKAKKPKEEKKDELRDN